MTMYYCIWLYITMYDYVWRWMTIFDYIWLCMTISDYVWLYMSMYNYVWLGINMYDYLWPCMTKYDYVLLCITIIYVQPLNNEIAHVEKFSDFWDKYPNHTRSQVKISIHQSVCVSFLPPRTYDVFTQFS